MFSILLFIINLSLILPELTPDKNNAIKLEEYEFKCQSSGSYGAQTYIIYNYQNRKYFDLITPYNYKEFALFAGDTKLNYETYTDNDYFYQINNNNILYLVVKLGTLQCISFIFLNTNSIILENNEEFKYPVVTSNQELYAKVRNVYNKHFIFYLNHTYENKNAGYGIKVNGISYSKYPGTKIFSYFPKSNELQLIIKPPGKQIIATLKYLAVPYTNITDDTIECITKSESIQSFLINRSKNYYRYFWYFLMDNNAKFYDNDNYKTELSNIDTCYPMNYEHFILVNFSCFQVKFTNDSRKAHVDIRDKDLFLITNTNTYNFLYKLDDSTKNINLTIYSSKNNFINKIKIGNNLQKLEIKNNKEESMNYFYNFIISSRNYEIKFDINFNINLLLIKFKIQEYIPPKEDKNEEGIPWAVVGIILVVCIIFGITFIFCCYKVISGIYEERRKERIKDMEYEQRLLENQTITNFYNLIKKNNEELNKVCLICLNKNEKKD